jgi:hypothetical protein
MEEEQYFLVTGTVEKTPYMNDSQKYDDMRLVKAYSMIEAEQKYMMYWENQSEKYGTVYRAYGVDATETIV